MQRRLLRWLHITELEALRRHKLAPLVPRRDMGMLGARHKVTLGTAPEQLAVLLPRLGFVAEPLQRQRLRRWRPLHNMQLHTHTLHFQVHEPDEALALLPCTMLQLAAAGRSERWKRATFPTQASTRATEPRGKTARPRLGAPLQCGLAGSEAQSPVRTFRRKLVSFVFSCGFSCTHFDLFVTN